MLSSVPAVGRPTQVSGPGPTVGLRLPRLTVHISLDSLHLRLWQEVLAGCLTGPCPGAPSRGYVGIPAAWVLGRLPGLEQPRQERVSSGYLAQQTRWTDTRPGVGGSAKETRKGKQSSGHQHFPWGATCLLSRGPGAMPCDHPERPAPSNARGRSLI